MENSLETVGVAVQVEQGDQLGSLNGTNGDLDTRYILKELSLKPARYMDGLDGGYASREKPRTVMLAA